MDGPIKQADVIMLGYPLNYNMSIDVQKNDLEFYEGLTTNQTPAMTWSFYSIGWQRVNELEKRDYYFRRSYQDYVVEPFKASFALTLLNISSPKPCHICSTWCRSMQRVENGFTL